MCTSISSSRDSTSYQLGITLIEIIIAILIIGILVAIAIPAYQVYARNSAEKSCLYESKAYANYTFVTIQDKVNGATVLPPQLSACAYIDNAIDWSSTNYIMMAIPKSPGVSRIYCDLNLGASCVISP